MMNGYSFLTVYLQRVQLQIIIWHPKDSVYSQEVELDRLKS